MSEQLNEKRNKAIRLFGAMSGVEEDYLAACEDYKKTKPKGVIVFMQKYGKGMAAVLCLAVLGAGYVSMQQVVNSDKAAAEMDFAMNVATASQECAEAPMAMEEEMESDWLESSVAAKDNVSEMGREDGFEGNEVELTLEEARTLPVVGEFVPDNWPDDGAFADISGVRETGAESVKIFWVNNDMQEAFAIQVENLGEDLPEWMEKGLKQDGIVRGDEFSKEFIVMNSKVASGSAGNTGMVDADLWILHESGSDYVLVRFEGKSTVDQILELLQ